MRQRLSIATAFLIFVFAAPLVHAQVPTFQEVVGHEFGERITQNYQSVQYLEAVAEASDRVVLEELGETWQRRPLKMAIVTSPENHARLDEIQRNAQRLGDPRDLSEADAEAIIADQPAILYFAGSIHGFELSGAEGALKLLEHLVTRDDAETLRFLENTVVLIDPILNPDGRDAFAYRNHDAVGREANPDNNDWSNDFTSWQGRQFRTGHYYFDTNRDWFAHTQRETQARVPAIQRWRPQAGVDAHEMGSNVEFYIDPPADPVGPFFPDYASNWLQRFGDAYARAFDEAGVDYMTRERFNYFYPAYTTSWLSYQGAVGMLYEQGSSRGLALTRSDGTVRTLATAAHQQYLLGVAAVELMANERETMLREYVQAHREAIADGEQGTRRYLLSPNDADPHLVAEVADLLRRNGVEVHRLNEETTLNGVSDRSGTSVGNRTFPAGTYVVEAAQPRNRLIRVLMEPHVPIPEAFLEEARHRVDRAENPRFYDITAWSLPLLFNIQGYSSTDGRSLSVEMMDERIAVAHNAPNRNASYAYLIDGTQAAGLPALIHLKKKGHRVAMLQTPTRIQGQDFFSGTGIVFAGGQADNSVHDDVRAVAERFELTVRSVDSGLAEGNFPSLGSGDVIYLDEPKVAILAEDPVDGYSFGWAWYTLDQQYEMPVSVIRAQSLGSVPLHEYTTLILPSVNPNALERIAGENAMRRLAQWVRDGGTLVTIAGATEVARSLELINLRSWYELEENGNAQRISTPGAFLGTEVDREEWLSAGVPNSFPALVNSSRIYLAPEGPPSSRQRSVVRVAEGDDFHISGHTWEETDERLPGAVVVYEERAGSGRVIAFAEDPNFRAYWRGANRLFLNAVLAGPSAP